jgi:hypothetical protein
MDTTIRVLAAASSREAGQSVVPVNSSVGHTVLLVPPFQTSAVALGG